MIFTQHWPPTVCFLWKEKNETHKCSLPRDEEWTIHGVWPTAFHTRGPAFCNAELHFDITALEVLRKELEVNWIDVQNGTKPYSFWKHEWEKHGTCANSIPSMNNITKYFQSGLNFLNEYDMKHVLAKASILPGKNYTVENLLNGVKKVLGVNSQVECVQNPVSLSNNIYK